MIIKDVEEVIRPKEGGMSFSATETYRSALFKLRTGEEVSVLKVGDFAFEEEATVLLKGEIRVHSDEECWEILMKFRKDKLSKIFNNHIRELIAKSFKEGQDDVKIKFRNLLLL